MLVSVLGPADGAGARAHAGRPAERCARPARWRARTRAARRAGHGCCCSCCSRASAPLWGVPQDAHGRRPACRAAMRMGGVAELAQRRLDRDARALRRRPAPPADALYFRGPVLSRFDGREWTPRGTAVRASSAPRRAPTLTARGTPLRYEVTLEPQPPAAAAAARGRPPRPPPIDGLRAVAARATCSGSPTAPVTERLRFAARAWLALRHGAADADPALQRRA